MTIENNRVCALGCRRPFVVCTQKNKLFAFPLTIIIVILSDQISHVCALYRASNNSLIWINGEDIFVPVAAACRETIFQTVNALHIGFSECVIERRLSEWRPMFHIQCEMNNNAHKKAKCGGKEFLSDHMQESHLLVSKSSLRYALLF